LAVVVGGADFSNSEELDKKDSFTQIGEVVEFWRFDVLTIWRLDDLAFWRFEDTEI